MNAEITCLLEAVREAGAAVLELQKTGFSIAKKANDDIVTKADLVANDILKSRLLREFANTGWLSEESIDDPQRLNCERVWIVDPIDGTREFARDVPEYAISVALVENGKPVMAAVFNPATDELFHAIKGQGAWQGENRLATMSMPVPDKLSLLASRSEYRRGEWDYFQQHHRVTQVGSIAYKLALIAAGYAHATFSLGPKNEWDIAAGVLLVTEAGGVVTNKYRKQICFNRDDVKVDGLVASAADVNERIFTLIENSPKVLSS